MIEYYSKDVKFIDKVSSWPYFKIRLFVCSLFLDGNIHSETVNKSIKLKQENRISC